MVGRLLFALLLVGCSKSSDENTAARDEKPAPTPNAQATLRPSPPIDAGASDAAVRTDAATPAHGNNGIVGWARVGATETIVVANGWDDATVSPLPARFKVGQTLAVVTSKGTTQLAIRGARKRFYFPMGEPHPVWHLVLSGDARFAGLGGLVVTRQGISGKPRLRRPPPVARSSITLLRPRMAKLVARRAKAKSLPFRAPKQLAVARNWRAVTARLANGARYLVHFRYNQAASRAGPPFQTTALFTASPRGDIKDVFVIGQRANHARAIAYVVDLNSDGLDEVLYVADQFEFGDALNLLRWSGKRYEDLHVASVRVDDKARGKLHDAGRLEPVLGSKRSGP